MGAPLFPKPGHATAPSADRPIDSRSSVAVVESGSIHWTATWRSSSRIFPPVGGVGGGAAGGGDGWAEAAGGGDFYEVNR